MLQGHQLDPTQRFSSRVEDYRRFRPGYPRQVLEILVNQLGFDPTWRVADIGSGTGLLTELFLKNGNAVCAVEPNGPMREAAERTLGGLPHFSSLAGSAETTGLPSASVDLIAAGQAFHWFEPVAAAREWRRVARGRGWVALIWNERDVSASPLMRDYEALLQSGARDYGKIVHRDFESHLPATFFSAPPQVFTLANSQRLGEAGFWGRLASSSYMPPAESEAGAGLRRQASELFQAHAAGDQVELVYQTRLFLGALNP